MKNNNWTHLVVNNNKLVGLAKQITENCDELSFALIELFGFQEFAEYGSIESDKLIKISDRDREVYL